MDARVSVLRTAIPMVIAGLLLGGCDRAPAPTASKDVTVPLRRDPPPQNVGETPMAQRVAVIALLNKRNGIVRNLTMKPGDALRVRDAIVRLRACETTAPWESPPLTGAFLQLDVEQTNKSWRRVFSGWVYKESPSLNAVENPIYDVWVKSCTMRWPLAPGESPPTPDAASPSKPSSAKKSVVVPSAEPSSRT